MRDYSDPEEDCQGDRVLIEDLRLPARIGVYAHEKNRNQTVSVSLEMGLFSQSCFHSDAVEDTIDYGAVAEAIRRLAVSQHFNLVEYLAENVARLVMDEFNALWIKVRIYKVRILPDARNVGVAITRLNTRAAGRLASSTNRNHPQPAESDVAVSE